jgi:hypothetical protein
MKRAGEVLSALFDERLMKKAQGYSRLFAYWNDAVRKNGIAAAADHSRIRELENGVLQIEADHPGWIQILQTKEILILEDFCRAFPGMGISGISLMLSRNRPESAGETGAADETEAETVAPPAAANDAPDTEVSRSAETPISGYDAIKDGAFKETLQRLEKSITQKERVAKKTL